ncbi:thiamine phosphate synthase [Capsulimonas corticalis]|uniref:thiamine phosphate synthase n=1 Tax=Capsulimonas corticalis TaxID=2219043 RepID=UPI0014032B58|nr:thiamine phosphate synthase [Capsulimonas corticalis]
MTDRNLYRQSSEGVSGPISLIDAAIQGGVDIVQLRAVAGETDDLAIYAVSLHLREMTAGKALFVVTGDIELAEKCHADGLMLREHSYRPSEARSYLRGENVKLVGAFARSVEEAARAERGGADYVQFGPVFQADEALEADHPGLALLRKIKDAVQIRVIGFGGVQTPEQAAACIAAGADGVAVTDAITGAADPQKAAADLRAALSAAWTEHHGSAEA